jgi:signal transduction histidine kinase
LLGLVVLVVVPVLVLQVAAVYVRLNRRVTEELHDSQLYAQSVATGFTNYLDSLWSMELALGNAIAERNDLTPEATDELLRRQIADHPGVVALHWLDANGVGVASTQRGAARGTRVDDREYVRDILAGGEKRLSDLLMGKATGQPVAVVARGIRTDGTLQGIMLASIDLTHLDQVLPTTRGSLRRYGLVDRAGVLVYLSEDPRRPTDWRRLSDDNPIRLALRGETVTLERDAFAADGTRVMGLAMPVSDTGWAYFSTASMDEVLAGARRDALRDVAAVALAGLVCAVLAWVMADRFLRPILLLQRAALNIAAGDLNARVGLAGTDEVADTARIFDGMAERVQRADEEQRARVSAVAYLGPKALGNARIEALAAEAAELVVTNLQVDLALIVELPSGEQRVNFWAGHGWGEDLKGKVIPRSAWFTEAFCAKEPLVFHRLSDLAATEWKDRLEASGIVSGALVAITGSEGFIGVIGVFSRRPRSYRTSDLHFLQSISNVLATAVDRRRIQEDEAFLAQAGEILAASLDYETTLASLAQLAVSYLCDECLVDVDAAQGVMRRVAAARRDSGRTEPPLDDRADEDLPDRRSIGADVLHTGVSVLTSTVMVVPLLARGGVVGVVYLLAAETQPRYGARHLKLAEELARRAAQAVDNAQLYREARLALQARDRALALAEVERARLHEAFDQAPALIGLLRGPDHVVSMVNAHMLDLVGRRDVLGKPVAEAVPELVGQRFIDVLNLVRTRGEPHQRAEVLVWLDRTGGGALEPGVFNLTCQPVRDVEGGVEAVLVYAVEVTEQVAARQRVERLAGHRATLAALTQRLMEEASLASLLDEVAGAVAESLGVPICAVLEDMPDMNALVVRASRGESERGSVFPTVDLFLTATGAVSGMTAHIPGEERGYGLLVAYARGPHTFSEDDSHFLESAAHVLGTAITRKRVDQRLATQYAVTMILAEAPSLEGAGGAILEALCRGLEWDLGVLWLVDPVAGVLYAAHTWLAPGTSAEAFVNQTMRLQLGPGAGYAGKVWRSGEPVWVADMQQVEGWMRRETLAEAGLHAGFWFPIIVDREVYGVVECYSQDVTQPDEPLLRACAALGGLIGQFAQRKRAEEALRQLNAELEQRVTLRTEELAVANTELEAFAYSVSHDLRAPLRTIDGFGQALLEDCGSQLNSDGHDHLRRIRTATRRMAALIDDLLRLSRVMRSEMRRQRVDLSRLAHEVVLELRKASPDRSVAVSIAEGLVVTGDERLLRLVLENLLTNAWKFTGRTVEPRIAFTAEMMNGEQVFSVRDNGAGFDMTYADKLFQPFQRLHSGEEFEGTGVGLATVKRIVNRHGGRVWASGTPGVGATFCFTVGDREGGGPPR